MKTLIFFPAIMVGCLCIQFATERLTHAVRLQEALEACYDSPEASTEECDAFYDAGVIWYGY